MDKKEIYDKMRSVILSVGTKEQLRTAIRYAQLVACNTGDNYKTGLHIDFALRCHPTLLFKPFPPPAINKGIGTCREKKYYKLDPDFLTDMLWL